MGYIFLTQMRENLRLAEKLNLRISEGKKLRKRAALFRLVVIMRFSPRTNIVFIAGVKAFGQKMKMAVNILNLIIVPHVKVFTGWMILFSVPTCKN